MRAWPPLEDPAVLEWLALDDAAWRAVYERRLRAFGRRRFDDACFAHALAYPWERPAGSYLLRNGAVELVEQLAPGERRDVVAAFAGGRYPLVAFGANGAPSRLQERFAGFAEPADREVLVLTGALHGVDVGAHASPTVYGSVPGALFASPGTAVRASVLWLTPRQLETLTFAELGYQLGRLDHARFEMDEAGVAVDDLFAYVSRIGALRHEGRPVALAAIPATGRSVPAMSQEEVLDLLAGLVVGPGARARDLAGRCFEEMPAVLEACIAATWPTAVRLPGDAWTPYPAG